MALRYGRLLKIETAARTGTRIAPRSGVGRDGEAGVGRNRIARRRLRVPKKRNTPTRRIMTTRTGPSTRSCHNRSEAVSIIPPAQSDMVRCYIGVRVSRPPMVRVKVVASRQSRVFLNRRPGVPATARPILRNDRRRAMQVAQTEWKGRRSDKRWSRAHTYLLLSIATPLVIRTIPET